MKKILIFSIFLMCTLFFGCKEKTDIEFAKAFFENLADGKASVIDDIDWENFAGTGFDVGGKLKSVSDISEKKNLKKSFINSFSETFKKSGLELNKISNWSIEDTTELRTIVSAEIKPEIFLFIVIINKMNERKVSSVMISNIDLKLSSEFVSTEKNEFSISSVRISYFPTSLIDKYIKNKEKKDAELIKKKGFTKRIGISYFLPSKSIITEHPFKVGKTVEFFDTNGYLKKSIHYSYFINKKITEVENKEKSYDGIPDVKLIDEKKGLYEETNGRFKYYYTLIDSLKYKIHKIIQPDCTSIYKYDKNNNLLNTFNVNEKGNYGALISFFYDSLGNVSRSMAYRNNSILNDSLYSIKYDSSGKIIESFRYYIPGTFDKNSLLFYKCNSKYDIKGNLIEKMFAVNFGFPDKIIFTYNSKNDITKIYYYGVFGPLFGEEIIDREYKYNDEGLLIETIDTGGDVIIATDVTKYTYE